MKTALPLLLLIFLSISANAQKKSELLAEIDKLKTNIRSLERDIASEKTKVKASETSAAAFEEQNIELRAANEKLLQNLNNFAKVSSKNSENVNKAMESLNAKEKQLSRFSDEITKNDSLAVVQLSRAKALLGGTGHVGVSSGTIVISMPLESFFENYETAKVKDSSKTYLKSIVQLLKEFPEHNIAVETLTNTGELELAGKKANALGSIMLSDYGLKSNRISIAGKDGGFKEGILFRIVPNYKKFYFLIKEQFKG